jgi:hypothetical protein
LGQRLYLSYVHPVPSDHMKCHVQSYTFLLLCLRRTCTLLTHTSYKHEALVRLLCKNGTTLVFTVRGAPRLEYLGNAQRQCKRVVQVLRKNHPHIPIHGDLHTLNLKTHAAAGKRLDVVVITTPCVDVSARGQGLAQQGQVCPKPRACI